MDEYYVKKAKGSEELIACWCWIVAAMVLVGFCVAVVKWIIAL